MQRLIKDLLLDKAIYVAILITVSIAVLSLVDISKSEIKIPTSDKTQHAIAYFFLTIFWLVAFIKNVKNIKRAIPVIAACFFYGIVLEVLQGEVTTYRTASYLDIVANSVGIVLAFVTFYLLSRKKLVI